MSFSYYDMNGEWYTCQNDNQYMFNPAYWGYYEGWNWVYSGTCGSVVVEEITSSESSGIISTVGGAISSFFSDDVFLWIPDVNGPFPDWTDELGG